MWKQVTIWIADMLHALGDQCFLLVIHHDLKTIIIFYFPSCLSHDETHCPVCGAPFDGQTLSSLLRITQDSESSKPFGNPVEDEEVMAKRLGTAILSVNDTMGLGHLRSLHLKVRRFLDSQPRYKVYAVLSLAWAVGS